jgi:hypothetical protein
MPGWRQLPGALLFGCALFGQGSSGTTPKPQPADYPAHAQLGQVALGAEYLGRSFFVRGQSFFTPDYLVIEVAVYPAKGERLAISSGQFTLRLNGKKQLLFAQSPGFVAASLKYPDWERRGTLEVTGGVGDTGVILGRPERVERFPGDPRPGQTRLPAPPKAPAPQDPSGLEKEPPVSADEGVVEAALPEGQAAGPVSGYLYFAYKGKLKSIRAIELLYEGPGGKGGLHLPN